MVNRNFGGLGVYTFTPSGGSTTPFVLGRYISSIIRQVYPHMYIFISTFSGSDSSYDLRASCVLLAISIPGVETRGNILNGLLITPIITSKV